MRTRRPVHDQHDRDEPDRLPHPPIDSPSAGSGTATELQALLDPDQVGKILEVSAETVLAWARSGVHRAGVTLKLQAVRFGRVVRFEEHDVLAFGRALGKLEEPHRPRKTKKTKKTTTRKAS